MNDNRGGGRFGNDRSMTPPVREGEEIDVTIESVGEKGDGMAKVQGFVLFVPGTKSGDRVRVKVSRVLAKVGFAEVTGEAQAAPAAEKKAPEPEFDPKEELDSESFGDEDEESSEEAEEPEEDETSEEEPEKE